MNTLTKTRFLVIAAFLFAGGLSGCGQTATSQGASAGALIGGLVDGWGGAAVGALVGGGVGFAVDSAEDKKARRALKEREVAALEDSIITRDSNTTIRPVNDNPLTGSTWRVISFVDDRKEHPDFSSMVLTFQTNTRATTLILWTDGKAETYGETYTIIDDVLVFFGKGYVTNSKFRIDGNQMVIVTPTKRIVLEEIEDS